MNYHRAVTQEGHLSIQLLRTIKDEMGIWKNESLFTLRYIEPIPTACFYAERGHNKNAFLWLYKLTSIWFEDNFLGDIFDF